ncbi:ubiquitin-protein transferase activating protein, partial [Mortierella sp. 14UC]
MSRRTEMENIEVKIDMSKGSTLHHAPSFSGSSTLTHHHIPVDSLDGSTESQEVARACGLDLNVHIFCFNAETPSLDSRGSAVVRQMYSRHPSFTRSSSNLLLKKRTILTSLEKTPDVPRLLEIGLGKSMFVWNADSGQAKSFVNFRGNTDSITSVSWAFDGSSLAVGTIEGDTQVWDVETKAGIRTMSDHAARVGVLASDKRIASQFWMQRRIDLEPHVRVHNHKVAELSHHSNEICGLTWRNDGMRFASGANNINVNFWDARSTVS